MINITNQREGCWRTLLRWRVATDIRNYLFSRRGQPWLRKLNSPWANVLQNNQFHPQIHYIEAWRDTFPKLPRKKSTRLKKIKKFAANGRCCVLEVWWSIFRKWRAAFFALKARYWRTNTRNVSFKNSLQWQIYFINPVDLPNYLVSPFTDIATPFL